MFIVTYNIVKTAKSIGNFTKHDNILIAVEEALQLLHDVTSGSRSTLLPLTSVQSRQEILAIPKAYLLGLIRKSLHLGSMERNAYSCMLFEENGPSGWKETKKNIT